MSHENLPRLADIRATLDAAETEPGLARKARLFRSGFRDLLVLESGAEPERAELLGELKRTYVRAMIQSLPVVRSSGPKAWLDLLRTLMTVRDDMAAQIARHPELEERFQSFMRVFKDDVMRELR